MKFASGSDTQSSNRETHMNLRNLSIAARSASGFIIIAAVVVLLAPAMPRNGWHA